MKTKRAFILEEELKPFNRAAALARPNPFVVLDPRGPALRDNRIITLRGGRGSGKTVATAGFVAHVMDTTPINVLSCREFQNSIEQSSKKEIETAIESQFPDFERRFDITGREIFHKKTSASCIFKGLWNNVRSLKSISDIGLVWIEEGQTCTKETLEILLPSIRRPGNRIIITMNPEQEDDFVYQEMIEKCGSPGYMDRLSVEVNYYDNPYFTESLESDRQTALQRIISAPNEDAKNQAIADYCWIWLGHTKRIAGAAVLKRWEAREFTAPDGVEFFHGADWSGGGQDPTAAVRCFEAVDETGMMSLWVDYAMETNNASLDELPEFFDAIPSLNRSARRSNVPAWLIRADSALPLAINKMQSAGFKCEPAVKAPNSVEDGIQHLNNYNRIYVHPRCVDAIREFSSYKWKTDRMTGAILPVLVPGNDHIPDAIRYAVEHLIVKKQSSFFGMANSFRKFRWNTITKTFASA